MIELFESILEYEQHSLYQDVLLPWLDINADCVRQELSIFSAVDGLIPKVTQDDLWALYALSRVNDMLLFKLHLFSDDVIPSLTLSEYIDFFNKLGFTHVNQAERHFSPFFHEIVSVFESQNLECKVETAYWPALMLGNMMFSRAGVGLVANRLKINQSVAENSTIYWTYFRERRNSHDLSHGWGSNSQWRTNFRRDYLFNDQYFFNVDAPHNIKDALLDESDDLTRAEYVELIMNRCFVWSGKNAEDLFPYDYRLVCQAE